MYNELKSIAKKLLPTSFLARNETWLRGLVALRYKGSKYQCNLCNFSLAKFIYIEDRGDLCPRCGSLPRTRRLWQYLNDEKKLLDKEMLHFSPPASIKKRLKSSLLKTYTTTDYEGEFDADKMYDITAIDESSNHLDLIICYHVLEHIENDEKAMHELYRILKPSGTCFIQTPFKKGAIYEDVSIKTKEDRLHHYGQEDHVRIYSILGLKSRLEKVGFKVEVRNFTADENNLHGFQTTENMLVAIKQ